MWGKILFAVIVIVKVVYDLCSMQVSKTIEKFLSSASYASKNYFWGKLCD